MFKRTIAVTIGVVALFAAAAASVFAWSGDVQGAPKMDETTPTGYYIWHNDDGWHLRTHGPGDDHNFVARLHTDGVFADVDSVRLESADNFAVTDAGHTILLRFHTYNWTDGLNFRVVGGSYVRFNLGLDGQEISTDSIFLGEDGQHPDSNPFVIHR